MPTYAVYPVDILLPQYWWQLVRYRLHRAITICGVTVPQGFVTDGATVPRLFWILFPPVCQYFPAAVVHDHLLSTGVSWKVANRYFRQALIELSIPKWRRILMTTCVAIYGTYKEAFQHD